LENIRRETSDPTVHSVANVLLINSYLDQGDYKRTQDFLTEFFNAQKPNKPDTSGYYFLAAGQVVKGAKNQLERYRSLGLSVSDRNLPLEAVADIEKMRETLELVITQSKALGKEKNKTANAMALLEEAANSRSSLARDDYDARRWKDETADAREDLANSRSVILSAITETQGDGAGAQPVAAVNDLPAGPENTSINLPETVPVFKPVSGPSVPLQKPAILEEPKKIEPVDTQTAKTGPQPKRDRIVEETPAQTPPVSNTNQTAQPAPAGSPLEVGSLVSYATKQATPIYPAAAKSMRMTGLVKVEVMVNEAGEVSEVQNTSGPSMLQSAAKDAIRKWKFKPFFRDGQPVKATGFINFNFAL
jgi:TonB family protein